ncbi:nuclear transport factor 2 family protein [Planococcus sp. N028]|uniref:Nuclear transport factor 2 family protein n=1 Tax=Planococcus shixiaomingii TaxID=3058393 RepID=A0ABT8N5F3_9BACL|nr:MULTISPECIES: nuclear transport factor 2 family protein [unclassified Planococcus (in: firmicutes)]MDN7243116.1 nuclear transport factor 2 family protein [Planococcus sp. N028]WKA55061.1 nuclear transport factor 2 family protein [Planococcus sp. N022]
MNNVIETADAWVDKVNAQDVEGVLEVSDPNIELIGPRGAGFGHDLLVQWMENTGVRLHTITRYAKGPHVVYEQEAVWENQDGHVIVYTFMKIKDGKVVGLERFDNIDDAFSTSGLNEENKVA